MKGESNNTTKVKAADFEQFVFDITAKIPDEDVMLMMPDDFGGRTSVMTRGGISTVTGQAKSRKSFFTVILMDKLIHYNINDLGRSVRILHIDTEQSTLYLRKAVLRLHTLEGWGDKENNSNYVVLSLCDCEVEKRMPVIEEAVKAYKPDFLLIDGSRDLVLNINDPVEATRTVQWCQHMVKKYNLHLCSVIHQNKNDQNVRGHLGSELVNKSESIFEVTKSLDMSKVSPLNGMARAKAFKPFAFRINDDGIPLETDLSAADNGGSNDKYLKLCDFVRKKISETDGKFLRQVDLIRLIDGEKNFGISGSQTYKYIQRMLSEGMLEKACGKHRTELSLRDIPRPDSVMLPY